LSRIFGNILEHRFLSIPFLYLNSGVLVLAISYSSFSVIR
jgi:hypothetical protein